MLIWKAEKLSLGHKQLEENPWDTFDNLFPIGSVHDATVIRRDDRGAIVLLPYGLEAFAPIRHIKKEDGNMVEVDETLPFKVIEFNRDDKRILVSHSRVFQDNKKDVEEKDKTEKKSKEKDAKDDLKKTQSKIEKDTIGDLDAFSELKEQFNQKDEN